MRYRVLERRIDYDAQIIDLLTLEKLRDERGIIYCKTPEDGKRISEKMHESGLSAYYIQGGFYQAKNIIKRWIFNEVK